MQPRKCVAVLRFALVTGSLVAVAAGCGGSGVQYSGVVADPAVGPAGIATSGVGASDTELGVVTAVCEHPDDDLEDGVSLGDLSCSEELLRNAMREMAAHVGGTHLADTVCNWDGREASCSAHVYRRATTAKGASVSRHTPFDPFEIEIRLHPTQRTETPAKQAARTDMVPRVPVSDQVFGDISARCDGTCDAQALRAAVELGARYAGAVHFGYPQCRRGGATPSNDVAAACRAWASAYTIDVAPAK
jgi:hypothetical protein